MVACDRPAAGCAACVARDQVIAEQGRAIEELRAEVAELMREVAALRRRVSRNSGNSSMAPSADDLPGRTPPPAKPKQGRGGRKPGKQPGAPGAHLAWSASPDKTVPHFPAGQCVCGADLAAAADLGVAASHQVVDVPLETATVTQHDLHEVACGCGRMHRPVPAGSRGGGDGHLRSGVAGVVCVPDRGPRDRPRTWPVAGKLR
jgi:Family of unknown function (DUF6444)